MLFNTTALRRDKSILYHRNFFINILAFIAIFISFCYIPLSLKWSIPHFVILLLFTLAGLIILTLTYNMYHKESYYNSDLLALVTENYMWKANITISDSVFNDTYLCVNIMLGLSMILIGLLPSRKTMSIKDKFLFIVENKKKLFIIGLTMLLAISALNMLLFILGLGITVDTSSVTLFLYTFFPKLINIRLILIFITCSITKEFKLDNVSLSLSSLIFMMLLGSVNYYYVLPYFKVIMFLGLTKLNHLLSRIYLTDYSAMKTTSNQSLAEGIYNIITKFPIMGRLSSSFRSYGYNYNILSPFRSSYNELIKYKINIYPITKISKFTKIDLFTNVEKRIELFYLYKGNINSLEALLKNDSLYLRDLISHFVSSYSNLTCKINLTCADQIVNINTSFKNGHLEEFNLNRTNLNFVSEVDKKASSNVNFLNSLLNPQCSKDLLDLSPKKTNSFDLCPKNIDSFYDPSADRNRELLHLTDPMNNGYDLQVFMQKGFRNYDYNVQQGESSRQSLHPFNSNRGIKRPLDSENLNIGGSTGISTNYPCLDIRMIELQNKNYLFLNFDPEKLHSERDAYLDEICTIGRTVLFEHYSSLMSDIKDVRSAVDNYKLEDVSISEYIDNSYLILYNAFFEKNKDLFNLSRIEHLNLCLFSKLYLDGDLDYSEDDNLDYDDNLDHGDNLYYSTQSGQEVLKSFEPKGNNDLIKWLRSKQREYLNNNYNVDVYSLNARCTFSDIKLIYSNNVFSEEGGENEFTNMLTKLWRENPDLFSKSNVVAKHSVNTLCARLRKLTPLYPETDYLSKENINIFTEELKTRIRNAYLDKPYYTKGYTFDDINIRHINGAVVEGITFQENAFTEYVRWLFEKKPEFIQTDWSVLSRAKLNLIYYGLTDLFREPLTKDEVTILINGLETRKNNLMEHRTSMGSQQVHYCLRDLFIIVTNIVIEKDAKLEEPDITRLLENYFRQINFVNLKDKLNKLTIDTVVDELKKLIN